MSTADDTTARTGEDDAPPFTPAKLAALRELIRNPEGRDSGPTEGAQPADKGKGRADSGTTAASSSGHGAGRLGGMPNSADLPSLPSFTPSGRPATTPLDILAEAALGPTAPLTPDLSGLGKALHSAGPYNPAATLPPKVVRKMVSLEFVEMSEMRADIWPDESVVPETIQSPRRAGKPPSDEHPLVA